MEILVVGAGLYGLTFANLAAELGHKVTVIDRRKHFGGNAHSYTDTETGIEIHQYGSHLFHTSNERVWNYISKFTKFNDYVHHVYIQHAGTVFPMPINLGTINQFFNSSMGPEEAKNKISKMSALEGKHKPKNLEEKAIQLIGEQLYEAFIRGYTSKQWQTDPKDLPAEVITRLPLRFNYDNRYFQDKWEGLPLEGYSKLFEKMLDHRNISLELNCDFLHGNHKFSKSASLGKLPIIYTGALDAYFDFDGGNLNWRTLDFKVETKNLLDFQGTSVMNYADIEIPFTRIHEFKHLHPEREDIFSQPKTVIMTEYSRMATTSDEPYYPVNSTSDRLILEQYRSRIAEEEKKNIFFGGRLGTYKYLDMHMAIASAISFIEGNSFFKK